ncbi:MULTISPECIES: GntR family transcriptional regulator [Micrococcales]|uniref:GntR family transcriptional regulator n=1 Tax=Micrococcales TaxID=85006 RepID=UPI0009EA58E8|nr:GntR family transcriptional regulator [Curtobacterium sp. S6]
MPGESSTTAPRAASSGTPGRASSTPAPQLVSLLRDAIVSGQLVPNQRLVEADLSEEYNASRGNVRIALSELSVEGLIERVQNRGARVRAVSVEEAVEITEVRGALEAMCARKAAERADGEQVERLRAIARRMTAAVDTGNLSEYSQCNKELHALIIEMSGQKTAAETIKRLRGQAVRYQFKLSNHPGRPAVSLPQHLAIIDAVCNHRPDAAAEAMSRHLASVADAIRSTED